MKHHISRPHNPYWHFGTHGPKRDNAGRFEALVAGLEAEADRAARRAELAYECLIWIDPTPPSASCEVAAPSFEVTPGGLSYQDAALQCLMGGCKDSLEAISRRAHVRTLRERYASSQRHQLKAGGHDGPGFNPAGLVILALGVPAGLALIARAAWRAITGRSA